MIHLAQKPIRLLGHRADVILARRQTVEPILSPVVRIGGHNSVQPGPSAVAVDDAAELDAGIFDGFAVAVADSPHNGSGTGQLELEIIQRLSGFEPYDRSVRI